MGSRSITCKYCRQRISVQTNAEKVHCPGCKQEIPVSPIENGRLNGNVPDGDHSFTCPIGNLFGGLKRSKISRLVSSTTKTYLPLNRNPSPLIKSSSARPRKRAVICGVSYNNMKFKLKGTINDVKGMRELLLSRYDFKEDNVLVLTEYEEFPELIPTRKNIEKALHWLVEDCKAGDSLVFYFSGHGLRQPDFNDDEIDGFDETICPTDFIQEGMILDNDINSTIVSPLVKDVTLHAIVDACHSGTILDLVHVYSIKEKKWMDNSPPSGANKGTNGGLAISISACEDNQWATDTSMFTGSSMHGVMTYILIKVINQFPEITYEDLIDKMHKLIDDLNERGRCSPIRRLFQKKLTQRPLLSSSEAFDFRNKPFKL